MEGHGPQTWKPPSWTVTDGAGRGAAGSHSGSAGLPGVARGTWPGTEAGAPTVGWHSEGPRSWGPPGSALQLPPPSDLQAQSALSPHYSGDTNGPPDALSLARPGTKTGRRGRRGGPCDPWQAGTISPTLGPHTGPDGTGMCGAFSLSLPANGLTGSRDPTAGASDLAEGPGLGAEPALRGGTGSPGCAAAGPSRLVTAEPLPSSVRPRCPRRSRRAAGLTGSGSASRQGGGPLSRKVRC